MYLPSILVFIFIRPTEGFFEDILNEAFGGGGGGGFQFQFGGSGFQQAQQVQYKPVKFPKGVTSKIHKSMDWLKGTEWMWNNWEKVRFESDGIFIAPTDECNQPQTKQCRWSADKEGNIYIMWGKKSGLHRVKPDHIPNMEDDDFELDLPNITLTGERKRDGEPLHAEFVQVYDSEIQDSRRDLYADLGLEPGSDTSTVKKAFRRMSIKYHPDKTGNDPMAQRKFTRISEANEILADPAKKFLYDMGGMESVRAMEKGNIPRGEDGHVTYQVPLSK
ncbi:hypothetical protein FOL47_000376, partial [Perkinsus chesapeaki]